MKRERQILVISYVFPPYPGIGGRRWAKFAKYLARDGYTVHVICSRNVFREISQWTKDVSGNDKIIRYEVPARYPTVLLKNPSTSWEKVAYKLSEKSLWFLARGNIYERALFWRRPLLRKASTILRENDIRNVVTTGAPFHLFHHAVQLKKNFPTLNIISDFRDQWTDNVSFGGYSKLGPGRLEYEKKLEREVLSLSDHVTTVSDKMTENLITRCPESRANFTTLHNGYDEDDFAAATGSERCRARRVRFVFAGNLYGGLEHIFQSFLDALAELRSTDFHTYAKLSFDFYGTRPESYERRARALALEAIRFLGAVPLHEIHREIASSSFIMLFLNDDHTFSMSTKFAEAVAHRKPIVVFSNPGNLTEYLREHGIGYACSPGTMKADLFNVVRAYDAEKVTFSKEFDVTQFSLPSLTEKLEKLLV